MRNELINVAIFNNTNTNTSNHYGCSLVMYNLVQKLKENHLNPVFFWPVGVDWRDHKDMIKKNLNFSAIIVNGEGTIHHNRKKEKANYTVEIAEFAKNDLKIPAYLINTTLYENSPELYEKIRYFNKVYVRESSTKKILEEHGVQSEIVPDLTFAAPTKIENKSNSANSYLITDSTFVDLRRDLKAFSNDLGWEYVSMKVRRKPTFIKTYGRKFQKIATRKRLKILKKVLARLIKFEENFLNSLEKLKKPYANQHHNIVDHNWFIDKIKSKDFVITGRFHTVTICVKTETPFVAIESNTPKISALLKDIFGSDERVIAREQLDVFSKDLPDNYLKCSNSEIMAIRKFNKKAMGLINLMFRDISDDIKTVKIK